MTSSVDWTTPAAYAGHFIPAPRKRSLPAVIVLKLRIWIRRQWRDYQAMQQYAQLVRLGRDLPDNVRKDIGLPPYHP